MHEQCWKRKHALIRGKCTNLRFGIGAIFLEGARQVAKKLDGPLSISRNCGVCVILHNVFAENLVELNANAFISSYAKVKIIR